MTNDPTNKNFFNTMSIKPTNLSDLEIGKQYPIYGMITEILGEDLVNGSVTVKIVPEMTLQLRITDAANLKIIKERAFEPGIFITEFSELEDSSGSPNLIGYCKTVVFGRKNDTGVN